MIFVKINGKEYAAEINGNLKDYNWNERAVKEITTDKLTHAEASELFVDDCQWSIIQRYIDKETGSEVVDEYDNADYSVAGDIIDHRDGSITIKMGKPTDLELAYEELYG